MENGEQRIVLNREVDAGDPAQLAKLRELFQKQREYLRAGMKPEHADVAACIWVYGTVDGSEVDAGTHE